MPKRTVGDIMARADFHILSPDATVREAARLMADKRIGAILVVDQSELAGIFTERDGLFRVLAEGRDPETTTLADVMTAKPVTVGPDDLLADALRLMRDIGFRHLPVVQDGALIGIVSLRDFVRAAEFAIVAG